MATVFTQILQGDIPGEILFRDDEVAAFLTIAPLTPGHTLVVPVAEVDRWTDLEPAMWGRVTTVAQQLGEVLRGVFDAPRAGLVIAGFEVSHVHLHVFPAWGMGDFDWSRAAPVDPAELAGPADMIRRAWNS